MARENEHEFLDAALQGNRSAVEFCQIIFRISQTWDDLIDHDNPDGPDAINRMMFEAMVELPENIFYQRFFYELRPLIRSYIADWMAANDLESEDDSGRRLAFVLRDNVGAIITQCAYLIGGLSWMQQVNVEVRKHIHEDSYEQYVSDLEAQT
jgi:hypothetical protein